VEIRLIDDLSEEVITERTLNLAGDETRAVEFETKHEFMGDFVIEAESVND